MMANINSKIKRIMSISALASSLAFGVGFIGCSDDNSTKPEKPDTITSLPTPFLDDHAVRWINYEPTNYNPKEGVYPSEESIREDVQLLKGANFDGIVTNSSKESLSRIPQIAKEEGIQYVIMGISSIDRKRESVKNEWDNAVQMKEYVDGYAFLQHSNYTLDSLVSSMDYLRTITRRPVTISEFTSAYDDSLLHVGDWIMPRFTSSGNLSYHLPDDAIDEVMLSQLTLQVRTDKPVFIDHAAYCSQFGAAQNIQRFQADYLYGLFLRYNLMSEQKGGFICYEAFDQPWKNNGITIPEDCSWYEGIFSKDREPKLAAKPKLSLLMDFDGDNDHDLEGVALNILPENHRIATYLKFEGKWHAIPKDPPLTTIDARGIWDSNVVPDQSTYGTTFGILLVNENYDPPDSIASPPQIDGTNVFAKLGF
jgi:exo-beta-1,3-glucanase (GH17 family)